jgi:L-aspartate oxidase
MRYDPGFAVEERHRMNVDVLIIGAGIGGAAAALRLAQDRQREILVISRASDPEEGNTLYAQGGIVTQGPDDSAEQIVADIVGAGAGASSPTAAAILAHDGPRLVKQVLIDEAGIQFDLGPDGELAYAREGGHSTRRVLHVGDSTGRTIECALIARLKALPNVTIRTGVTAVDLITSSHHLPDPLQKYEPVTCLGAYVLDQSTGQVDPILARHTVLATGGLGRIYRHTSNPRGARGDGLAMASRAGARIVNAEYVQFHPTTLPTPDGNNFLITEAVRGEGAKLLTPEGRRFMGDYAPEWMELAPRDVVARAIHNEMTTQNYPHVLLDLASVMAPDLIRDRFPTVYRQCFDIGYDITAEPIPVVPAAHYSCGGVLADEHGCTTVRHLYAVGEVSCTGIHGANRLASTSLLEGLVWGYRAGSHITQSESPDFAEGVPQWENIGNATPDPVLLVQDARTVEDIMWHYVGLVRNASRLGRALGDLNHLW